MAQPPPGGGDAPSSSLPYWGEDDAPAPPSSRLCVKNIPKHLTLERLREHFAERGEVTDAKIMKTGDGKSRQMAFVGYKTEEDATKALEYFNNTFVDTSKISVEYARAVKSTTLPRPWSRHSEGSSAHARSNAPAPDPDAPEPPDPDRFVGVRELKKMKNAKKHAAERELEAMLAADPKLAEFMELMAPRSKQKIWDNQDVTAFGAAGDGDGDLHAQLRDEKPAFEDDGSDDDAYDQDLDDDTGKAGAAKGVKRQPARTARKRRGGGADDGSESDSFDVSDESDVSSESDESESDTDDEGVDALAADDGVSDMEYLKKRAGAFSESESDEDEDASDGASEEEEEEEEEAEEEADDGDVEKKAASKKAASEQNLSKEARVVTAEDMEAIAETGRVFARNLPFTATEEEVAAYFSRFGPLTAVHVIVDKTTRRSKGLAYVTYALPENGVAAMEALDGTIFQGRLIHLIPAKRPPVAADTLGGVGRLEGADGAGETSPRDETERSAGFKADRDARLKADAGTNRAAWNSLFMRQDTVAAAVAAKYGVSKADLLESGDADVAVRLALGEAQIIADTKAQLEARGGGRRVSGEVSRRGWRKHGKRRAEERQTQRAVYPAEEPAVRGGGGGAAFDVRAVRVSVAPGAAGHAHARARRVPRGAGRAQGVQGPGVQAVQARAHLRGVGACGRLRRGRKARGRLRRGARRRRAARGRRRVRADASAARRAARGRFAKRRRRGRDERGRGCVPLVRQGPFLPDLRGGVARALPARGVRRGRARAGGRTSPRSGVRAARPSAGVSGSWSSTRRRWRAPRSAPCRARRWKAARFGWSSRPRKRRARIGSSATARDPTKALTKAPSLCRRASARPSWWCATSRSRRRGATCRSSSTPSAC
jgi:RNA recognition motif-containing protein